MEIPSYDIRPARLAPSGQERWDSDFWRQAGPLSLACFRPEGGSHRPKTLCKLLYNQQFIFGIFRVEDQFVRSRHKGFQSDVWKDSCVEFFVQPGKALGYFNFEFNCTGSLLASYVINPARREDGALQSFIPLVAEDDQQIRRWAGFSSMVDPEIAEPVVWTLAFSIPVTLLAKYSGELENLAGQIWRANFYKCGNETSHPHWVSWAPLAARNFHDPQSFGRIRFCR